MCWSEFIQEHNPLDLVIAVYHAPMVLTREDARLAGPLAAIRKASAERIGSRPVAGQAANPASVQ
jgi:hypothetical protein